MLEFIFFHAHGRKMTMVSRQELLDRLEAAGYPGQVNPLGRKIRPQSRRWPIVVTGPYRPAMVIWGDDVPNHLR